MFDEERGLVREHPYAAGAVTVALGGTLLYQLLKPEAHFDSGENYFDIIAGLNECITREVGDEVGYVMLGGGTSAALAETGTKIDTDKRLIIPPDHIHKDQYRKETGVMADMDILVFSREATIVDKIRAALTPDPTLLAHGSEGERARELAKPGHKLKVGVTGLRAGEEYDDQPKNWMARLAQIIKSDWVSHRLEYEDGSRFFAIADSKVRLPDEYFEPWHLVLKNGEKIPVPHPLVQVLCYLSRASHGVRPRDINKIKMIMDNIGSQFGARLEWGQKNQTATLVIENPVDPGVEAALKFSDIKNSLRWPETRRHMGIGRAAVLAARMALHRQLDTRKIFIQFGQDGFLYDHVLSRLSGERQQRLQNNKAA